MQPTQVEWNSQSDKILVAIDVNMDVLFESDAFIKRMCDWLNIGMLPASQNDELDELVACAALCIGNLARTGMHF